METTLPYDIESEDGLLGSVITNIEMFFIKIKQSFYGKELLR